MRSSSALHLVFLIFGSRWLCHRSRHCLLILPGKCWAISLQLQAPFSSTSLVRSASWSGHQEALFLTSEGSITKLHRSRHCLFERPSTHSAIRFQSLPNYWTAIVNFWSSSGVQGPLSPLTNSGLRALYHRSRHYTLLRPTTHFAIYFQFFEPYFSTASVSIISSSLVQWPLSKSGFKTLCQRYRHCILVLPDTLEATSFHFLVP